MLDEMRQLTTLVRQLVELTAARAETPMVTGNFQAPVPPPVPEVVTVEVASKTSSSPKFDHVVQWLESNTEKWQFYKTDKERWSSRDIMRETGVNHVTIQKAIKEVRARNGWVSPD